MNTALVEQRSIHELVAFLKSVPANKRFEYRQLLRDYVEPTGQTCEYCRKMVFALVTDRISRFCFGCANRIY